MSFTPEEIAAAYALDCAPRVWMAPSTRVGWAWGPDRVYREWRVFTSKRAQQQSTQLALTWEDDDL